MAGIDKKRNTLQGKLRYHRARFAEITIHPKAEDNTKRYRDWVLKKANMLEEIQHFEHDLSEVKIKTKETPNHIPWE